MFKFISTKHQSSIVFLAVALVSILCRVHSVTAQDEPEDETDLEAAVDYEDLILEQPPVRDCHYNCSRPYSLLCGSDRKTYGNMCHLNTKNRCDNTRIRKVHDGTCRHQRCVSNMHQLTPRCKCPCTFFCTTDFKPVCGTNGITYSNTCQLASRAACLGYPVRVCHKGPCRRSQDEDEEAPEAGIVEIDYIDE